MTQHRNLFPSLWIFTLVVIGTIVLNLFSGIKIINLGNEHHELELKEISLKEREKTYKANIASSKKILQELPSLKTHHSDLSSKIAALEGTVKDYTERKEKLMKQFDKLQNDLETALSNKRQAEAVTKSAQKEMGRLKSEIKNFSKESSDLQIVVSTLKQDKSQLELNEKSLFKKVKSLETEITSLNKTKEIKLKEIESLTEDNRKIVKINSNLNNIVSSIENSNEKIATTADNIITIAENAQKAIDQLNNQSSDAKVAIQNLNDSNVSFNQIISEREKQTNTVKDTVKEFSILNSKAQLQSDRFAALLDKYETSFQKQNENLFKQIENVAIKVKEISKSQNNLKDINGSLEPLPWKFNNLVTELSQSNSTVEKEIKRLQSFITESTNTLKSNNESLSNQIQNLSNKAIDQLNNQSSDAKVAIQNLNDSNVSFNQIISEREKQTNTVKDTVKEFSILNSKAQSQSDRFAALLDKYETSFQKQNENLFKQIENVAIKVKEISKSQNNLKDINSSLEPLPWKFNNLVTELSQSNSTVEKEIKRLQSFITESTNTLKSNNESLSNQIQNLSNKIQFIEDSHNKLDQIIGLLNPFPEKFGLVQNQLAKKDIDLDAHVKQLRNIIGSLEEQSKKILIDGNMIKRTLQNIIQDTKVIEKEIRNRLEEAKNKEDQPS